MVTQRERVVRGTVSSDHVVQLFDSPESLGECVAAFLHQGYQGGGRLIVAAKAVNVREISKGLERRGLSVSELMARGSLTILDAHATLRALLRNGTPDPQLFDAHLGDLVAQLAGGSEATLHIYGELVEVLAEEGNFQAANELEDLWNELAAVVPFSLLCGYSSAHFAAPNIGATLQQICGRHTRVHQSHADLLGNWLLAARPAAIPTS